MYGGTGGLELLHDIQRRNDLKGGKRTHPCSYDTVGRHTYRTLSIYHHIGEYAGAGAAVPITGFSNTVVSAAMEFKREGFVPGMGAKIFTVAGPVIVYGTLAGVAVAFLKWIIK